MITNREELFTTNWAIFYDGWVLQSNLDWGQIYKRGDYTIRTNRNVFYLLLYIYDKNLKLVISKRIYSVDQYLRLKKKLRWT